MLYKSVTHRAIGFDHEHLKDGFAGILSLFNPIVNNKTSSMLVLCVSFQDTTNVVYIISGRRQSELERWLGGVPRQVITNPPKLELPRTLLIVFVLDSSLYSLN